MKYNINSIFRLIAAVRFYFVLLPHRFCFHFDFPPFGRFRKLNIMLLSLLSVFIFPIAMICQIHHQRSSPVAYLSQEKLRRSRFTTKEAQQVQIHRGSESRLHLPLKKISPVQILSSKKITSHTSFFASSF